MSFLPEHIVTQIEELTSKQRLKADYARLSDRYRTQGEKGLKTSQEYLAYLASRMPATYAANVEVYQRLFELLPDFCCTSVLDVGSGPATSMIALQELGVRPEHIAMCEQDPAFIGYAKQFLASYSGQTSWQHTMPHDGTFDLVISSYMLSELDAHTFEEMLLAMIDRTRSLLVLIDTGTPRGFEVLKKARERLIEKQMLVLAPCPHQKPCPMLAPDWCHFSVRLPRSRLHKQVKGAERGFEDEKFCYLIASKQEVALPTYERILSPPQKRSGHVYLKLCTHEGTLSHALISKKTPDRYQLAKKASWGDICT